MQNQPLDQTAQDRITEQDCGVIKIAGEMVTQHVHYINIVQDKISLATAVIEESPAVENVIVEEKKEKIEVLKNEVTDLYAHAQEIQEKGDKEGWTQEMKKELVAIVDRLDDIKEELNVIFEELEECINAAALEDELEGALEDLDSIGMDVSENFQHTGSDEAITDQSGSAEDTQQGSDSRPQNTEPSEGSKSSDGSRLPAILIAGSAVLVLVDIVAITIIKKKIFSKQVNSTE